MMIGNKLLQQAREKEVLEMVGVAPRHTAQGLPCPHEIPSDCLQSVWEISSKKSSYLRSHKHINTFTQSTALIIWPSEAATAETGEML